MAVKKLRVAELDFDGIKNNLISFLKEDPNFGSDGSYNYEGSALSTLLDVLAYNTHYMGYYVNMLANEMFLDSASKRESIVSIAKHLGYTPSSSRSASITFDITSTNGTPITADNEFIGHGSDGTQYKFYPITTYQKVGTDATGYTNSKPIVCKEGKITTKTYVVDTNNLDQKFLLDENADTTTLKVNVKLDTVTDEDSYNLFTDISELNNTSKTYFLQEASTGQFEVIFGDGTWGNKLSDGSIITFTYSLSS